MLGNDLDLDGYKIVRTLGEGYSGVVKLGQNKKTKQMVALKIINKQLSNYTKVLKDLEKEAIIISQLNHRHIIKFIDFQDKGVLKNQKKVLEEDVAYAVFELAKNGEVFEVIFKTGALKENTLRHYLCQLLDAMQYLHSQNIVHRDLKPENILLGEFLEIKLADFGFATQVDDQKISHTQLGTERYMCPELMMKKKYDAKKADVFALGVILFVFMKGQPPFEKADIINDPYYKTLMVKPQTYWKVLDQQGEISREFKEVIEKCLAFNPNERWSLEDLASSKFMEKEIDEESALLDMRNRFNKMSCLEIQNIDDFEIEDSRSFGQDIKQVKESSSAYNKILENEEDKEKKNLTRDDINFSHNFSKEEFLKKLSESLHKIPNVETKVKQEDHVILLECVLEGKSKLVMGLDFFKMEERVRMNFFRVEGHCFDFHKVKKQFLDMLSMQMW